MADSGGWVVPPEFAPVEVKKYTSWVPLSLEMKADMGMPLTDEERAELDRRDAERRAYRRTWRYRWGRLRMRLVDGRADLADRIGGGSYYRYGCDHD